VRFRIGSWINVALGASRKTFFSKLLDELWPLLARSGRWHQLSHNGEFEMLAAAKITQTRSFGAALLKDY
jgi:hypothetical protein